MKDATDIFEFKEDKHGSYVLLKSEYKHHEIEGASGPFDRIFQLQLAADLKQKFVDMEVAVSIKPGGHSFSINYKKGMAVAEVMDLLSYIQEKLVVKTGSEDLFVIQKTGNLSKDSIIISQKDLDKKRILDIWRGFSTTKKLIAFGDQGAPGGSDHDMLVTADAGVSVGEHEEEHLQFSTRKHLKQDGWVATK